MFGFDHDAGELLSAGIAKDDATVFAECGLGFGEGTEISGSVSIYGFERTFTLTMSCG